MAIYVLSQPLAPNDLWYHLRAGAWMVQHHSFPRVAMFTPSVPANTPYFYQSWLAEIVMYLTLKWTGLAGSQMARAICFTGAIAIIMASAAQRAKVLLSAPGVDSFNDGARRAALVGLFVLFMSIPNTDLRPQAFSLPLFALFAAIIFTWTTYNNRQLIIRAACLIGLMAVWANTHGAFATGLILLLLFCIGETLHFYGGNSLTAYLGKRLDKTRLKLAWITFAGCAAAACINPQLWKIYAYVYALASNTIGEKYIQEWQPPTWSDGSNSVFFCCGIASLLLLILLVERFRNKQEGNADNTGHKSTFGAMGIRPGEFCVAVTFFVMGLRNVRSIIWFALIFLIVGTALICRAFPPKPQTKVPHITSAIQRLNVLIAVIFILLAVPFFPWFKPLLPWPKSYMQKFAATPAIFRGEPAMLLSNLTPTGAADFLRQSPPRGLLWNNMVFGSYLVWALYPAQGPWADPRVELRPDSFWYEYMDTGHAKNDPARTLIQKGFSDVLIDKEDVSEKPLLKTLAQSPQWHQVYEDQTAILFRVAQASPSNDATKKSPKKRF